MKKILSTLAIVLYTLILSLSVGTIHDTNVEAAEADCNSYISQFADNRLAAQNILQNPQKHLYLPTAKRNIEHCYNSIANMRLNNCNPTLTNNYQSSLNELVNSYNAINNNEHLGQTPLNPSDYVVPTTTAPITSPGSSGGGGGGSAADDELSNYINNIYTWAISIGGALTVLIIIIGGYEYATSAGEVEKINQAKEKIIGAIMGLVVLILAALILSSLGVAKIS